jgi:hypothetical protein
MTNKSRTESKEFSPALSKRRNSLNYKIIFLIIISIFLISATPPPKKKTYPAQTGTYTVDKHKSSGKKGVGGLCFIDASQY